jgi:SanA protein
MKTRTKTTLFAGCTVLCVIVFVVGIPFWTRVAYSDRIYSSVALLPAPTTPRIAIVFGAGVWSNGDPSPILHDRIATGAELYRAGKVRKLLLSGDNRAANYNEPAAMRETALAMGVKDEDIVLDYAGRRTYDSCFRAKEIFGVQDAVLVTQGFHMNRAMYLCNELGIKSEGVLADRRVYPRKSAIWWSTRELGATLLAFADLRVLRPTPILGDRLPINTAGSP